MWCKRRSGGQLVVWLRFRPVDRMVSGSIPNFLTNSSGQATNALVSLFTKQWNWYQLASGLGVHETRWALMPRSLTQESISWSKGCMQSWNMFRKKNQKSKIHKQEYLYLSLRATHNTITTVILILIVFILLINATLISRTAKLI